MFDPSSAPFSSAPTPVAAPPKGWQAVSYAILPDGTLAMLATDVDLAGEYQRMSAARERFKFSEPLSQSLEICATGTAGLWLAASDGWVAGPSFPLETPFPKFDRFSDGRWLVIASRSNGKADGRVLARDGAVLDRLPLGDGIAHVAIDAEDRIWVGWFDEGIFGNSGWQLPGQEWPPSSNGVACFAADGALLPLPLWPPEAETEAIADCYALNVMGSGAWACPYPDFPLAYLVPGEPARWWRNHLPGAKAIAVAGNHALVAGGYAEEANRLALVELVENGVGEPAPVRATWTLPLRRRPPSEHRRSAVWHRPTLLTGRGDTLHLVDCDIWYRWRVSDAASSLRQSVV